MGGDSFPMPVWRSVGDGFTGKGESDLCSKGRYLTAREPPCEQNGLLPIVNIMQFAHE